MMSESICTHNFNNINTKVVLQNVSLLALSLTIKRCPILKYIFTMPNLQLNSNQHQSQLQNTIRVMVESELARTRNSNQQTNPESVTGSQQEAAQFHLA